MSDRRITYKRITFSCKLVISTFLIEKSILSFIFFFFNNLLCKYLGFLFEEYFQKISTDFEDDKSLFLQNCLG